MDKSGKNYAVRQKATRISFNALVYILLAVMAVICLLPFWLLLVNSTRSSVEIQSGISFWFGSSLMANYNTLNEMGVSVWRGFANSLFIAAVSTGLNVFVSAMTAWGFAMYRSKVNKILFTIVLGIIMIPSQLGIIGFYQLMAKMGLLDSYIGLIIPAAATPTCVFFMKQYLDANLHREIIEAARVDGSTEFMTFLRIGLPMMKPAVATMGILGFIGSWNNYMGPLMILTSQEKFTLPLLVDMLKSDIYSTQYGSTYLGLMLSVLPLLIIYLALSKYIIQGVALGGVKE